MRCKLGNDASLHFIGGQLLLEYKDGEAVVRKCISPEAARKCVLISRDRFRLAPQNMSAAMA